MPDRTTRADTTSVERDHTEEMPQAEAAPRVEHQQQIGEQKVLEVKTRDLMDMLCEMMNQFDQNFQALNKQLEQMELRTI